MYYPKYYGDGDELLSIFVINHYDNDVDSDDEDL